MLASRRIIAVVAGLILITVATVVSSKMLGARKPVLTVGTAEIAPKDFSVTVSAQGTIEPLATVEARAEVAGRIVDVFIKEGDVVKAGQEIARLDSSDLHAQLQQAKAAVASAEADLLQLGSQGAGGASRALEVQQAEAQLQAAKARLSEVRRGPSEAQLAQAYAELTRAGIAVKDASRHLKAMESLYREGAVSLSDVEDAGTRVTNATAQHDAAEKQYEALLATPTDDQIKLAEAQATEAEIALALARERAAAKEKTREAAHARLKQARTNLALIEAALSRTSVAAPENGVVMSVLVTRGAVIMDGTPVARLARDGGLRVRARVDETDVAKIVVGQRAGFTTDALIDVEFDGKVAEIGPAAVPEGAVSRFPVLIDIDGQHDSLRPGMTADVEIVTYSRSGALTVPIQAVVERDGAEVVFVLDLPDSTARMVQVRSGLSSVMEVEILDGLQAGDELIVGDAAALMKLESGDRVRRRGGKR